jgi:hypothetical protein
MSEMTKQEFIDIIERWLPSAGYLDSEHSDCAMDIESLCDHIDAQTLRIETLEQAVAALRRKQTSIQNVVNRQAEDLGLWFLAETVPEGYVQQELRALHRVIESAEEEQS